MKKFILVIVSVMLLSVFLAYPPYAAANQSDNAGLVNLQAKPDEPANPFI